MTTHQVATQHPGIQSISGGAEVLTFSLGAASYAVDILKVQEIRSFEQPIRLANAAPAVRGILNLRGDVIPVIDLRTHLAMEAQDTPATVTVVLTVENQVFGAVVDAVVDVVTLPLNIQPPPKLGNVQDSFIQGIATETAQSSGSRTLQVVDLKRLFEQFAVPTAQATPALQLAA